MVLKKKHDMTIHSPERSHGSYNLSYSYVDLLSKCYCEPKDHFLIVSVENSNIFFTSWCSVFTTTTPRDWGHSRLIGTS